MVLLRHMLGDALRRLRLRQGRVLVPNNNTIYGALAVTDAGRALLGFTLVGDDHYPGDSTTAGSWPGMGPGVKGVNNAFAPK